MVQAIWSQTCLPRTGDWFHATEDHWCAYFWTKSVGSKGSIRFVRPGKANRKPHEQELKINMNQKWGVLSVQQIHYGCGIYWSARTRIPEWPDHVYVNLIMIDIKRPVHEWHRLTRLWKTPLDQPSIDRTFSLRCLTSTSGIPYVEYRTNKAAPKKMPCRRFP